MKYKIWHGSNYCGEAANKEEALRQVAKLLEVGYVNVLVTRGDIEVESGGDYEVQPDGRIATLFLEIPIV